MRKASLVAQKHVTEQSMIGTLDGSSWVRRIRLLVALGLLSYLASHYFLGSSKTFFYSLVAIPSVVLAMDLRHLLQGTQRTSVSMVLAFVTYFALSALWSADGQLVNGTKLALSVICLMLAVHSSMCLRPDSPSLIRRFILIVGSVAACLYCLAFIGKAAGAVGAAGAAGYADILSPRYTLRALTGSGDNNPINTAIYFGVITLAAWETFPQTHAWKKLGLLLLMGSCIALMFLTKSRGPFLSLAVVLFAASILRRHRDDLVIWGGVATAGLTALTYFDLIPVIMDRAASPNYRGEIWQHAIELIKDNLFFGQGLGESADIPIAAGSGGAVIVGHSHSSILETFRVGGLVGGTLFLALVFSITRQWLKKRTESWFFVLWLAFGLLCLSTNGRLPLIRPSIEWFAFWIPLFFIAFTPTEVSKTLKN